MGHIEWFFDRLSQRWIPTIVYDYPSSQDVRFILAKEAEFYNADHNTYDRVSRPKLVGYLFPHPDPYSWNQWVGYGILDAHDEITLTMNY